MGLCIVLLSLLRPLIRHCVSPRLYSGSQKLIRALKHNMWKLFVQNSNNIIFTDILVGQNLSNPECFVIWGHFIVYINILDYFEPFGPIWALGDFGQIQRCKNLGSRVTFWFVRFFQTISHFPSVSRPSGFFQIISHFPDGFKNCPDFSGSFPIF